LRPTFRVARHWTDPQEALHELQDAIHAWIEAAQAAGNLVPPPSASASDHHHSGKVLLRMPRRLHAQLARAAKQEGVSLNQYIVYLLSSASGSRMPEQPGAPQRATSTAK
jgi:predicted HicB family RNase H-like nuclease